MNLFKLQALLLRMQAAGCEFALSVKLCLAWCAQEMGFRRRCAVAARAVDDSLEAVAPDLEAALANDSPEVRRRILRAVRSTHSRSEALARELALPAGAPDNP